MKDIHIFNEKIKKVADAFEIKKGTKIVSYTQFSMYDACPKSWELTYIKKNKTYKPGIDTIFGTAMHTVIQLWLTTLYQKSVKKSNELDLPAILKKEISIEYLKELKKNENVHFSTPQVLYEYWEDGTEILTFLRKKRLKYFSTRRVEFVGFEIPIVLNPLENIEGVKFQAYLDLVFKDLDTNQFEIIDIKTSKRGWKEWDKKNVTKISQVILYKMYYSQIFNVPIDDIKVSYFILKRKLDVNSEFPQSRIQTFVPSQGSITLKKTKTRFTEFVSKTFNPDGTDNENINYPAFAGTKAKNCFFCQFKDNFDLCPQERRIEDV